MVIVYGVIVTDKFNNILALRNIVKSSKDYFIRKNVLQLIEDLVNEYDVDCIIYEKNKLFIDKIDKYPDPFVLHDIKLGYGIINSIIDKYYETSIKLLEIPYNDWYDRIMNRYVKYAIDLYKNHVLLRSDIINIKQDIETNNYYKLICFSEVVLHDELLHRKYLINKGD